MKPYRKSKFGAYPDRFGWRYQVVAPDGTTVSGGGFASEKDARAAGAKQARFYDKLERDRVDDVKFVRTGRVIERGIRPCKKCGQPHDLVMTTRRGRRWGQTWENQSCGTYYPTSWEEFARQQVAS